MLHVRYGHYGSCKGREQGAMAKSAREAGYQEIRGKLGVFGWIWRILFLVWQAAMVLWLVVVFSSGEDTFAAAMGLGLTIGLWVGGTIIIGLLVLLTRRTKTLVPIAEER